MQVAVANGMSGEQVALMILEHNGLADVPVNPAPGGPLSDHYDPRNRTVNLSQDVYSGRSVASVAIAAHEVGHAIQHAEGIRAVQGAERDGTGRRLRLERLVHPVHHRDLRADHGPRDARDRPVRASSCSSRS